MINQEKLMPIIYIAGNYSNGGKETDPGELQKNRDILRYYSSIFMKNGWAVIAPIENDLWAYNMKLVNYDDCLNKDFAFINRCDAIFFCPGWEKSKGALLEHEYVVNHAPHVIIHQGIREDILDANIFREYQKFMLNRSKFRDINWMDWFCGRSK